MFGRNDKKCPKHEPPRNRKRPALARPRRSWVAKPEWKKSGVGVRVREGAAQGRKVRRRGGRAQEKATQNLLGCGEAFGLL